MISKHGAALADAAAEAALVRLIPKATLITPNLAEAAALTGIEFTHSLKCAKPPSIIAGLGAHAVLVKGGHLADHAPPTPPTSFTPIARFTEFPAPRIATRHTHGTGCTYSAAITALLARGFPLENPSPAPSDLLPKPSAPIPASATARARSITGPPTTVRYNSVSNMTKVQKHFRLQRPLDETLMQQIADAHSIYGIETIRVLPSREELMVEFDASRLVAVDVEAALQRAGVPVVGVVAA